MDKVNTEIWLAINRDLFLIDLLFYSINCEFLWSVHTGKNSHAYSAMAREYWWHD